MSTEIERWSVSDIEVMAERVAKSRLFGLDAAQAFTLMMIAQSEGIHPIKAVQRYNVPYGKPAMKADAMMADFQTLGGTVKWLTKCNDCERAAAIFKHPVHAPDGQEVSYTVAEAKRAGYAEKNSKWQTDPARMLIARVKSIGVRLICPGIVAGFYTPEEVEDLAAPIKSIGRILKDPVTDHGLLIPEPMVASEAPTTAEPEPPPGRETGSDDEVVKDGKWLLPRITKRGFVEDYAARGKKHGFPDSIAEWSVQAVKIIREERNAKAEVKAAENQS